MTFFKTSAFLAISLCAFYKLDAAPQTLAARLQAQISELASEIDHMKARVTDLSDQLEDQKRLNARMTEDLRVRTEMLEKKGGARPKPKPVQEDELIDDDRYPSKRQEAEPPHKVGSKGGYDPNPSHVLGTLDNDMGGLLDTPADVIAAPKDMEPLSPLPIKDEPLKDEEEGHEEKPKPQDFLSEAREKMQEQDFESARSLYQKFIKGSPKSPKIADARYGVGESYFAEKSYGSAAKAYLEGYQKHKTAPKGPDFLFKLGQSLDRLGKKAEACKSYEKLLKEYPKASDGLKKRVTDAKKKACALPKAD